MYVHGLEEDAAKDIHYIAFRTNFLNIKLSNQFYARFNPQAYYLRVDEKDGFYISSGTCSFDVQTSIQARWRTVKYYKTKGIRHFLAYIYGLTKINRLKTNK
jgi:hypothetical protein